MIQKHVLTIAIAAVAAMPAAVFAQANAATPEATMPTYACTMDAKQCSDGTWVGRTGPNCEFVCPGTANPAPIPPIETPLPPAPVPPADIIKRGTTNDAVKDLQTVLKIDPTVYTGPITGYFGPMTEAALKKLQAKYGLPQSGVLDSATRNVLFPVDTQVTLAVLSPNGGENWRAGEMQKILWKASFGPKPCMPRPACLDSEPRCLPAEPVEGWCPVAGTPAVLGATTNTGSEVGSAMPATIAARPTIAPYFPRATLTLLRDSDPSFMRTIGTVNLYESSKIWTIPRGTPEATDYRVQISVGGATPCLYRAETEAVAAGKALDAGITYPCPMMSASGAASASPATTVSANSMLYPIYSASDASDNPFAIVGGTTNDTTIAELKRKLAEIETMLVKIQEQMNLLRRAIGQL